MNADELRARQAPLKERYRAEPAAPEPDQLPLNGAPAERTLVD